MSVRAWLWKRNITSTQVAFNQPGVCWTADTTMVLHKLREGFRANCWRAGQHAVENDAQDAQEGPDFRCSANRAKLALKHTQCSAHHFAVLIGDFCPPAAHAIARGSNCLEYPLCCSAAGHIAHMYWASGEIPNENHHRPRKPVDPLQARLERPRGVLSHIMTKFLLGLRLYTRKPWITDMAMTLDDGLLATGRCLVFFVLLFLVFAFVVYV